MRHIIFLLTFLSLELITSAKTIIFTTDKYIDISKINIYFLPSDNYVDGNNKWDLEKINKKTFSFTTDLNEFYIECKGCITYKFENIQQIKGDTITIDKIKLINYNTTDTINTSVLKYKRDSTVAYTKSTNKIIRKKKIDTYIPNDILINRKPTSGQKLIENTGSTTNACTPYKIAIEQTWTGRQLIFVYKWSE